MSFRETDNNWKSLDDLRETDRDYSGLAYSYQYAKNHKDLKSLGGSYFNSGGSKPRTVSIKEVIEIKEDPTGKILYRVIGKDEPKESCQEFHTQFGTYLSDNHGEFGGILITPGGKTVGGNFRYIFDLKDKVYAIDTCAHLTIAHFGLFRFVDPDHCCRLYSVGGYIPILMDYEEHKGITEDLCCQAVDVKEDKAYILLSGHVTREDPDAGRQWWYEERLLKVENEEVEEVVRLTGYISRHIRNLIVQGNVLYVSCDKMVIKYDMSEKKSTFFTCLSEEDEADLLENKEEIL